MGKVIFDIRQLMKQSGADPIDLVRAGVSQGTAYRWVDGNIDGIRFDRLSVLLDFFSARLHRRVGPEEILFYNNEDDGQK